MEKQKHIYIRDGKATQDQKLIFDIYFIQESKFLCAIKHEHKIRKNSEATCMHVANISHNDQLSSSLSLT